ncbi:TPA: hypothetical protein HA249_05000 [Candidatus Woesearchaeota archaeon]|nr:MAG: hypothetical protein QT07_C0001G0034 [archaeon GW2011_AR16]HIG96213.1 hypothetical protein [Candidatus Woesearchaeota archaeon]
MYAKLLGFISILIIISLVLVACTSNQPAQDSEQQKDADDAVSLPATGDAALDESLTVVNTVKDDAEEDDTDKLLQDLEEVDALLDEI